ncbi:lysophospholipid acyltransferase family protein [Haloechinothrix halophila]|uniref:lysophospholipid acyltransferase family protein n=1 Tax=Haloechinothrix halophila TaxID=1069073 RepID=UPI0005516744|nr:lysophospholipid acyltransferase family protein [Haloechinothrix halophila]
MSDAVSDLPAGAHRGLHDVARLLARWVFRPAFRIRMRGSERVPRTGPIVLVANHTSMVEPQLLFGLLPRRSVFLVKEEMFHGPVGRGLELIGQLPVRRGEPDRTPLLHAVRLLRSGGMVGVFPEGTRGSGDVKVAELGAAWLVRSSGAIVQPVAVRGTRRPAGTRRRFRPTVDVYFGEPFALDVPRGRAGLADATEQLRVRLADTVAELDTWRATHGGSERTRDVRQ